MNNKWKWVLGIPTAMNILLLPLLIWTLFLPNGGNGIIRFGMVFPAWLIMFGLLVLVLVLLETIEEGRYANHPPS
jgi:hypothetical protein